MVSYSKFSGAMLSADDRKPINQSSLYLIWNWWLRSAKFDAAHAKPRISAHSLKRVVFPSDYPIRGPDPLTMYYGPPCFALKSLP
jgi:hypothetical protein